MVGMYKCGCGTVNRSTWYRHKVTSILQNQSEVPDDIQFTEPLPVEDAPEQEESDSQDVDQEQTEIKILT